MIDVPWANITNFRVATNTLTDIYLDWSGISGKVDTGNTGGSINYIIEFACSGCTTWSTLYDGT